MNKKILTVATISLAIDQITKIIMENILKLNSSKIIIKDFFYLTLCHNEGAAWGILNEYKSIIIILTLIALIVIYHFIYCFKNNTRNNIAFGLLIGGLSGNLVDRLLTGYVRDFLDFIIINYDYPVFNFADISIVLGVILIIYATIKGEDLTQKKEEITIEQIEETKEIKEVKKNANNSKRRPRKTRQVSSK